MNHTTMVEEKDSASNFLLAEIAQKTKRAADEIDKIRDQTFKAVEKNIKTTLKVAAT